MVDPFIFSGKALYSEIAIRRDSTHRQSTQLALLLIHRDNTDTHGIQSRSFSQLNSPLDSLAY